MMMDTRDVLEKLVDWLQWQAEEQTKFGDSSLVIEQAAGNAKITSTGHYQRAVAYKKTLQEISRLETEEPEPDNAAATE